MKRKGKGKSNFGGHITKLGNKKLNQLAKKGKLKGKLKNTHYVQLLQNRILGNKGTTVPQEAGEIADDIPIEEADYEYYASKGRKFSFLTEDDSTSSSKKRVKKSDDHESTLEMSYESRKRNVAQEVKNLLPIKDKARGLIPMSIPVEVEDTNGQDHEEESTEDISEEVEALPELCVAELFAKRQKLVEEKKLQMATLANHITSDPEANFSKLRELRSMLLLHQPEAQMTVVKFAMVTLMEVFKDIIPDYRIRPPTDKEKSQMMKKETKKLREFEEGLLNNYQHYLDFLEFTIKGKQQKTKSKNMAQWKIPSHAAQSLQIVGLRCMSEMLSTHPHFNFRTNIISVIGPYMNSGIPVVSDLVCFHIKKIFRSDPDGEVTIEITRLIGRIAKAKNFDIRPKVLETFLALKIKEVDHSVSGENKKSRKEAMKKLSRKERKRKKQSMYLERELEEAAALTNKEKRIKIHTEIINMVFLTYFRILKNGRHSVLLPTVLQGLAKFAHLINVDFFHDLFNLLTELVNDEDLNTEESLHCIQTAFSILNGQGSVLNIDPMTFYKHLYKVLNNLHSGQKSNVRIALCCLDLMLNKRRRQISTARMHAFLKRLCTVLIQHQTPCALGLMATARNIIQTDSKNDIMFDGESQGVGFYLPELDDPEYCNASNSSVWELHIMRHHYNPTVRMYAKHLCAGIQTDGKSQIPIDMAKRLPEELYDQYTNVEEDIDKILMPPTKGTQKAARIKLTNMISEDLLENVNKEISHIDFYSSFT